MRVALTPDEMYRYACSGVMRAVKAMEKNRRGAHGFNRHMERWQIDVEGLLAEYAAAKALDLPYEPVVGELDTEKGDVAARVQVRSTKYTAGSLLVHDSDADDDKFMLVTGIYGVYDMRGWVYGHEGKNPAFTKTYKGRTAYWVPQTALRPFDRGAILDHLAAAA